MKRKFNLKSKRKEIITEEINETENMITLEKLDKTESYFFQFRKYYFKKLIKF